MNYLHSYSRRPNSGKLRLANRRADQKKNVSKPVPMGRSRRSTAFLRALLAAHHRRLEAAGHTGRILAGCLSLAELYENLSSRVFALLPDAAHLYVFRTEKGSPEINFIHAVQNSQLSELDALLSFTPPPAPAEMLRQVVHSQHPLIINNPDFLRKKGLAAAEQARPRKIRSMLLVPMIARCRVVGVLELLSPAHSFNSLDADLLSLIGNITAMAIDNRYLSDELTVAERSLSAVYENTIEGYRRALEIRDRVTEGHSIRVANLAVQLAGTLGFTSMELMFVRFGAMLHDIGKIGVPDRVLLKAGPLDADDLKVMRRHPEYALEMLSTIPNITPVLEIPYYHHEKWDGSGYPRGLKGENIPIQARIFAVIDVYDALCSERPYRTAWNEAEAVTYIRSQSGRHFDPHVVEAFLAMVLGRQFTTA